LIWLAWVVLTLIAWVAAVADVKGSYPDWDYEAGGILSLFIYGALLFAWSIWILWLLFGRGRRLYSWFRIGICFALFLSMVRLLFMAEVVKFLRL